MLVKKVLKTIETHNLIKKGDHIVIGISGGPDSVCLFNVLNNISKDLNLTLHPVHVNHRFRPRAAEEDQRFVERLCAQKNMECHSFVVDCNRLAEQNSMTSEEAGRKARYDAFYQVASQLTEHEKLSPDSVKIAVAQNANDQAETILFRIMRGTGTDGLAGIAYRRRERDFDVIRPLLDVFRCEIEEYCAANDIATVTDETNNKSLYTRNKIRLELIPYLRENYNSNVLQSIIRMGHIAAADKEYIWSHAEELYNRAVVEETAENSQIKTVVLKREELRDAHDAIAGRAILKAFSRVGLGEDITAERLSAIRHALGTAQGTSVIELPRGYRAIVAYDRLEVTSPDTIAAEGDDLMGVGQMAATDMTRLPKAVAEIITCEEYHSRCDDEGEALMKNCACFDLDRIIAATGMTAETIVAGLTCRTYRQGDFISLSSGRKKLQRLFMDMKVSREKRSSVQLIAVGSEVFWIMGYRQRFAERYKITGETENVMLMKVV